MGVNGGLGCGLCPESLRRDAREPTAGDLARSLGELSSPEVIGACRWLLLCGFSIIHEPRKMLKRSALRISKRYCGYARHDQQTKPRRTAALVNPRK